MMPNRSLYTPLLILARIVNRISAPMTLAALMLLSLVGVAPAAKAQSCTGLCLQQITCPSNGTTSISGKVYAPNGTDVLPGVLVYVPNAAVQPFTPGAQCLQAGQPASGSPLISTVTAADGTFTLTNAPVGSNIPLVIQAGKWRRQFVIPTVSSCSNTALPSTGASQIRFPRTKAEGDIPQIAIVTGSVDSLECVMRKIGVADTEFTNPGGSGRINLYTGVRGPGATIAGGGTPSETVLESTAATLATNDVVMLACQGDPYTPTAAAQSNVMSYANAGGRILATHYSYDFLNTNFPTVAQWDVGQNVTIPDQIAFVNTTFAKGLEFAQWLQAVGASTTFGQVPVQVLRQDQDGVIAPTQSFLSINNPLESIQFTFNTPVAVPTANQCGRVLFNEYHVEQANNNTGMIFPNECPAVGTPLTPQEQMLEFSIFDLSTFVSPDVPPTGSVSFTSQTAPVTQGDTADSVVIVLTNTSTTTPMNPSVTATVSLPVGLTATALGPQNVATSGWTCNLTTLSCKRTTGIDAGASDNLLLTFSVAANAPAAQTITATLAGGGLAANVTNTDNFPVKIVPTITWPNPAPILYGTALSATQLDATVSYNGNPVPGTLTYTPTAGTIPGVGSQTLGVMFVPTDTTTYASTSASVSLQVNQATPTITWATPVAITYGTALSATQLNATATFNGNMVPGTFNYMPGAGTLLNAGMNQSLSVLFTPNDTNTYTTATGSVSLTVNPAPLTVTAGGYSGTYDGNTHALSACVVSNNPDGLTCTNSPVGPAGADVTSAVVTPVLSGPVSNYNVTTNKGAVAITPLAVTVTAGGYSGTYDGTAHAVSACTSTYVGVSCGSSPTTVGPAAGSGPVTATSTVASGVAADYAISSVPGAYSIATASSLVTLTCPASVMYTGAAQTPCMATATGVGGLSAPVTVTYTTNVAVGTAHASATYGGDANHSGSSNSTTFAITAAPLTVTAGSYSGTYDGHTHALSACVVSANPDGLTCTNSPAGTVGPGVTSAVTVTPLLSGSASNYSVSVTNGSYAITPLAASVTPNAANKVYGTADPALTGTLSGFLAADGVTATYSRISGETVAGSPYTISAKLSPTAVLANYSITYNTAPFTITKATPTLTWATPSAITYGTALSATQLDATSNTTGSFAYTPPSGVLAVGTQSLSVLFTPSDAADYTTATKSVSLTVNKASTITTIAVTTTQTVSGTIATITATVTPQISGSPTGTVTYMNGTTVLGSAAVGTPFTTGTLAIGANQLSATYSGDSNFNSSTSAKTTVTGVLPTTVQLIIPVPTVLYPLPVAYTVIVPLKGLQLISGTITIYDGATAIATLPLLPGGIDVGLTLPVLTPGTHQLKAVYSGDSHYPPGQSPVITVNVVKL